MTERPLFAPSADGARDVLRRARARRRRQALLTTGGLAVAGALAGVLVGLPGAGAGADRLTVVPASPAPSGHPDGAPAALAQPSSRATEAPRQGPAHDAGPVAAASTPTSSPTPYAPTDRHSAAAPITRTVVPLDPACDAAASAQTVPPGWCVLYSGPTTAHRKHRVALSMELCRPAVYGDATVRFSDSRQIDFELLDADATMVWQAGQGVRTKNTTSAVVVRAGTCLRWTAAWDSIARNGFYAPPGTYSVSMALDSPDISASYGGDSLTLKD